MAILGLSCKLFRGTAGTTAATEMTNVKDVTVNMEVGEADITTRAANGWKQSIGTLKDASIEFEMLVDSTDADYAAVRDAFLGNTALAIFASNGSGSGLDCDAVVTNFSEEQPLEEAVTVKVTLKPTNIGGENGRAPTWKIAS